VLGYSKAARWHLWGIMCSGPRVEATLIFEASIASRRQILWGARLAYEEEGVSMLMLLNDFVLFSFVVTLIAGLVLATASLLG
jgi:hypothetical protein